MSTGAARKQPRQITPYTFEDFCALIPDGQKADLIDGVIYVASPDNTEAGRLTVWLTRLVADYVDYLDLGEILISRIAFRLDELNSPEPDLAFIRKDRLHLIRRGYFAGPPDLVLEIVSPESIDRDYVKKRRQYEKAGVPEYWIVDELSQKVTLLRLGSNGRYREIRPRKGVLTSRVLPGFWLKPAWLWQRPLSRKADVLAMILEQK
jgi:Uma2 family endonuclease